MNRQQRRHMAKSERRARHASWGTSGSVECSTTARLEHDCQELHPYLCLYLRYLNPEFTDLIQQLTGDQIYEVLASDDFWLFLMMGRPIIESAHAVLAHESPCGYQGAPLAPEQLDVSGFALNQASAQLPLEAISGPAFERY